MPLFNWNQLIAGVPDTWRQTEGAGVKIALLDSGADLAHPALKHLDKVGRKFFTAKPGFNALTASLDGETTLTEGFPGGMAHGTACLSILAAQPEGGTEGLNGVAPKADVYSIRVCDEQGLTGRDHFFAGLQLALRLDVDVICAPVLPSSFGPVTAGAQQAVFDKIAEKRIILVSTLKNSNVLARLNQIGFPADQPQSIVTGVVRDVLLGALDGPEAFSPKIDLLFPQVGVSVCSSPVDAGAYKDQECSCSFATACLAGIIALKIAHWKTIEPGFQRHRREDVLDAIAGIARPFSKDEILSGPTHQFYNPKSVAQV
jgi:subtilisin